MLHAGNAGTGKSTLLRVMVKALQEKWGSPSVFVTASTGISSVAKDERIHALSLQALQPRSSLALQFTRSVVLA